MPDSPNRNMPFVVAVASLLLAQLAFAQHAPSVKQWLSLRTVGAPVVSPDGGSIAYIVTSTDWENNRYDAEIWVAREGAPPVQLTATEKGRKAPTSWRVARHTASSPSRTRTFGRCASGWWAPIPSPLPRSRVS